MKRQTSTALTLLLILSVASMACRADTVASLLGNFTINQFCGLTVAKSSVAVHYTVVYGQLPALSELHAADADGNGVTSQRERDAYVGKLAPTFARGLELEVDGLAVPLQPIRWTSSLPTEQGGFSLRVDVDYAAELPVTAGSLTAGSGTAGLARTEILEPELRGTHGMARDRGRTRVWSLAVRHHAFSNSATAGSRRRCRSFLRQGRWTSGPCICPSSKARHHRGRKRSVRVRARPCPRSNRARMG